MSSEGTGAVAIGAGLLVAAPLAAAVGLGILAAQGIMWCGKKMEENYANACNQWTAQFEAARAANLAKIEDVPTLIAGQIERMAAASANLSLNAVAPGPARPAEQQELVNAIARVRSAIENAQDAAQVKADTGRELLMYRLRSEIESARGMLPPDKIAVAETALRGSLEEMRKALSMLQAAWRAVTDTQAQSTHHARQALQLLNEVKAQLNGIEIVLHNAGRKMEADHVAQKRAIQAQVEDAQQCLNDDPAQALALATAALKAARGLARSVSVTMLNTWGEKRKEVITLQGTLDSLSKMRREAVDLKLMDARQDSELARRITVAQSEAQTLLQSGSAVEQKQFDQLAVRVEMLKEDVFHIMKTKQQSRIAETVATTLGELGFTSSAGGQPVVKENGDVTHVEALRAAGTTDIEHDDKVISFDITQNGNISYDFSGYVGNSCLADAEKVFAALRAKGIFILEETALDDLRKLPTDRITLNTLQQERYKAHPGQNKAQAELAERLKAVIEQMGFSNIRQSVIGGCIDLEAFNGQIGYRVVLPPDGSSQVFKDTTDVSGNMQDPIAAEAAREPELDAAPKAAKRTSSYIDQRKQQKLGS